MRSRFCILSFLVSSLIGLCSSPVLAEPPVVFCDPNLKAAVEAKLGVKDPTPSDMNNLTSLEAIGLGIKCLGGLEYATHLEGLNVENNQICDIEPLRHLSNLQGVTLSNNPCLHDLSPLSGKTRFEGLVANNCSISEVPDVSAMTQLHNVYLRHNRITSSGLSRLRDREHLVYLFLCDNEITDLSWLCQNLPHLTQLQLSGNHISNIAPVACCPLLEILDLSDNNDISDISPISGLTKLQSVSLSNNKITDLPNLCGLDELQGLRLSDNKIRDVSALACHLNRLGSLYLDNNPLDRDAYCHDLLAIKNANPGVALVFSPNANPPEGVFATNGTYENRVEITWDALCPGPGGSPITYQVYRSESSNGTGMKSVGSSTGTSVDDTTAECGKHYWYWVKSDADYGGPDEGWLSSTIYQALYVDDDAPNDPGPHDSKISDPKEDGTPEHPFDMVQEAIDVAEEGRLVIVRPGTYLETINLLGKGIEVNGLNSEDGGLAALPVIDGRDEYTVVQCIQKEGPNCVLKGFVITGGRGRLAGGIECRDSSPTISHCVIAGNRATSGNGGGGGIYCLNSKAKFINCTVAGNYGGVGGAGLRFENGSAEVTSSIVWGNSPVEILAPGSVQPLIRYTDVAGGWSGVGNKNADPLFAKPGYWANPNDLTKVMLPSDLAAVWVAGDYHLQSRVGRWNPDTMTWVKDAVASPCIDAGDPTDTERDNEPWPNGNRVNMGAYGATGQASKSQ